MEDRREAGHAALDLLLDHDVGRVEAGLRTGWAAVVDLDHSRRSVRNLTRQPGERQVAGSHTRSRGTSRHHRLIPAEATQYAGVDCGVGATSAANRGCGRARDR